MRNIVRLILFAFFILSADLTSAQIAVDSSKTSLINVNTLDSVLPRKSDKLGEPIKTNIITDSSLLVKRNESIKKTQATLKNSFKKIIETGQISLGCDYGFLPYTLNQSVPNSAVSTEGQIGLNLLNIPIDISYFYTTQKNLIGLNNYFRVSYNADRYKNNLNSKLNGNVSAYKDQLSTLTKKRQNLLQRMSYADYLSSVSPERWPIDSSDFNNNITNVDTIKKLERDSINIKSNSESNQIKPDSTKNKSNYPTDSIYDKVSYYKHKSDSVRNLYDSYEKDYNATNDSIEVIQSRIKELESHLNGSGNYNGYLGKLPFYTKAQSIISGIKKFEIGLCYPNYSSFLVNNIPVRGINFEYSKSTTYLAFTYGTTVSTVLFGRNNIEGFLQNVRNTYNYFDFNNVTAGRKIVAAKIGYGSKEGTHVFIGLLVGKGRSSYLPINGTEYNFSTKESNVVLEADIRYKFNKSTLLDINIGKSSIQGEDLSYDVIRNSFNEIFSNYRSNAILTKIQTYIKPTKSNLTFSVRIVDPFFKSYGLGFLRSDNIRYECKLDQFISKRIRYVGSFRYEEDNLLNVLNYKNKFYSIGNTLSIKLNRRLMLRGTYTPIYRNILGQGYNNVINNHIATGVVTFNPRIKKGYSQMNFIYNYYLIETDSTNIDFQNFAFSNQLNFNSGFRTGASFTWFKNTETDSINNNVLLTVIDIGYQFVSGSSVLIGGKAAFKSERDFYPGFLVKVNVKLLKGFFWETQFEKFVIGDLFNGYDLENLKKFPYYCSTRLVLNF